MMLLSVVEVMLLLLLQWCSEYLCNKQTALIPMCFTHNIWHLHTYGDFCVNPWAPKFNYTTLL